MSKQFYVYRHRKADTGEVFYVGKGQGRRAWSTDGRNDFWRRVVAKHGRIVEVVEHFADEQQALAAEVHLIADLRAAGVVLANLTDGGEGLSGYRHTEAAKEKVAASKRGVPRPPHVGQAVAAKLKGRRMSDETRARMSASAKGRPMSPEAIEKTAAAHRGKPRSDETKRRISEAQKGRPITYVITDEMRAQRSENRKGKKHSEETKRLMSLNRLGKKKRPQSPEHRARIAEARRQYWAGRRAALSAP